MRKLLNRLTHLVRDEDGPTAVEYAVMIALIMLMITLVASIGDDTSYLYSNMGQQLAGANNSAP